jgi:hypothetical protein
MAAIMTWTKAKVAALAIGLALVGTTVGVVIPRVIGGGDKLVVVKSGGPGSTSLPNDAAIGPSGMIGGLALSAPI